MRSIPSLRTTSKAHACLLVLIVVITVILTGGNSGAQGKLMEGGKFRPDDPLVPFSRRWDIDGDGVSTCNEWRLFMTKLFYQADSNHDKVIDAAEVGTILRADPVYSEASFTYFDADENGVITRSEFIDQPNPFFVFYDTDKDCRVTRAELEGAAR